MKKRAQAMVAACMGFAASVGAASAENGSFVYIGSRDAPSAPTAATENGVKQPPGIYAARLDAETGKLTLIGLQAELVRSSWLVTHPSLPVVYSIARAPGGAAMAAAGQREADANIHAFKIDNLTGKLQEINRAPSGALYTTHLSLDPKSLTLFGAGFESGDVTALALRADGGVGALTSSRKQSGTGPHPRQKSAHPHAVAADLTGHWLVANDFGADRIYVYRFDPATRALTPAAKPFEQLPPGAGPRHLAFHPSGKFLFMNTELTAEVRSYKWDANTGGLQPIETVPTWPAGYAGNDKSTSEVAFSSDGRFFYVGLRGDQDSILVYAVNGDTGRIQEIQRISAQGKRPWSFGIDPSGKWLLVANDASNSVNVFGVDRQSGRLSPTTASISIPNPSTIAFYAN